MTDDRLLHSRESGSTVKHGPAPYVLQYIDFADAYLWLLATSSEDWEAESEVLLGVVSHDVVDTPG